MKERCAAGRRSVGAREPTGRRTTSAISLTLLIVAAGALGRTAVAKRRRAASANEPLEPNGLARGQDDIGVDEVAAERAGEPVA